MKAVILIFSLLCLSLSVFSQRGAEIGVMGGSGYYIGEYNRTHFNNRRLYMGVLYRYNLNDRFAFRLNTGYSDIDMRDKPLLANGPIVYSNGFHRNIWDVSVSSEFNFRSFLVRKTKKSSWWSPYMYLGVGALGADKKFFVSIPAGVGVKFNLFRQLSWGIEWGTRKLFTDKIDRLTDAWGTGETNFIYNKDWFFVAGVTLTYRFSSDPVCHF